MSDKEEKIPQIRFKDFDDAWKPSKMGSLLKEVKRPIKIEDDKDYQLVTVKRRNGGVTSRGIFKGKDILVKNYFELKQGDYLISKRQVVHGANGFVTKYLDGAVVSNEYLVSVGNENITTDFLTIISHLPQMYKMFFLSSYGIDIEKLVFNVEDWKKRTILIPTIGEQNMITNFFELLDKTIILHQHKYDLICNVKQSYLQKMFSKNGEKVPEIRFEGYTDNWEKRKLSDFIIDFSEKSSKENEYPVLSSTNSGMEERRGRVSAVSNIGYKIIDNKDLVLSPQNLWLGNININNMGKGLVSPSYKTFKIRNISSDFLLPILHLPNMLNHYKMSSTQGASVVRRNLDIDLFNEIPLSLPDKQEQVQIGSFFKQVEDAITLQKRKLDLLKEVKKTMLKKMFI